LRREGRIQHIPYPLRLQRDEAEDENRLAAEYALGSCFPNMSDIDLAERLNDEGMQLREDGKIAAAETAYRAAMAAAPTWSAPVYNLGLLYKYENRWKESLEHNRRAAELAPDDEASWWNLGIAATALSDWAEARRAWSACGIEVPPGDGPLEFKWGETPVRLDPEGDAEVVWARRIDPARAQIVSVPLPTSSFHWGDVVLTDGAVEGERVVDGRTYPVFNALQLMQSSGFRTFIIELATSDPEALAALERCATERGAAAEDWGSHTSILCRECSRGTPHEHASEPGAPAHPHCGLAARDHDHAEEIISTWLANAPTADLTVWYEAPIHAT
jgi:tetratricopeptide (TPR) repeat protein